MKYKVKVSCTGGYTEWSYTQYIPDNFLIGHLRGDGCNDNDYIVVGRYSTTDMDKLSNTNCFPIKLGNIIIARIGCVYYNDKFPITSLKYINDYINKSLVGSIIIISDKDKVVKEYRKITDTKVIVDKGVLLKTISLVSDNRVEINESYVDEYSSYENGTGPYSKNGLYYKVSSSKITTKEFTNRYNKLLNILENAR